MANEMNKRLIAIESDRNKLEVRPFVMITDYSAYTKDKIDIIFFDESEDCINAFSDPNKLYIQVSNDDKIEALCLALSLTNTTQSYISVQYFEAELIDERIKWSNSLGNQKHFKLRLQAGQTKDMVFYAPIEFLKDMVSKHIRFKLILENRFGARYAEYFNIIISDLSLIRADQPINNKWFVSLEVQDFALGRFEKDSDGKIIEIPEEI
jgi:hypothetical protein